MSNDQVLKTYVAKTDLSAKKGYAVIINTDTPVHNTAVAQIATSNVRADGIIVDGGLGANYAMSVCTSGYCKAVAGDTIAAGNLLKSDTNGALVPADTDKDKVVAKALKAAAAGESFDVFVNQFDLAV